MDTKVREMSEKDLESIVRIYQDVFANDPWHEYMKCTGCEAPYGIDDHRMQKDSCYSCGGSLELEEYWPEEVIKEDLYKVRSASSPVCLVAENGEGVVGFCWGSERFEQEIEEIVDGHKTDSSIYINEVGVRSNRQSKGIGTKLVEEMLEEARQSGYDCAILRTNPDYDKSMGLYKKLGFEEICCADDGKVYMKLSLNGR